MTDAPRDQHLPSNAATERPSVAASAVLGEHVDLGSDVHVEAGAVIVGPVRVGSGSRIGAGVVVDAGAAGEAGSRLVIEDGVDIATGSTLLGRLVISRGAQVQAGTVVVRDVPPYAIVAGNPAEIIGYTLSDGARDGEVPVRRAGRDAEVIESSVTGVTLHHLPRILDLRGNLTVGEFGRSIPFEAKRYFMVFGVPNAEIRGEHAHRTCKQFLVCARGHCSVVVDDGATREEFLLDDPATGLYLPALTWGIQYKYSPDAVLIVFASEFYDSAEYIRDYGEFTSLAAPRVR